MEQVVPRRIVYLREPLDDPQGNPGKETRRYVIVRVDSPITEDSLAHVVAITGEFPAKPHPDFVVLKFGPNNRSKLTKPCAAMCTWSADTKISNIENFSGIIDPDELHRILKRLQELKRIGEAKPDQAEQES